MKPICLALLLSIGMNVHAMDKLESFNKVQQQLKQSSQQNISVIVELEETIDINMDEAQRSLHSANSKNGLMNRLSRLGAREHKRFEHLPVMALQIGESGLRELEQSPEVKKVYLNQLRTHSLRSSIKQVQADQAWSRGYTGENTVIAIIDAGFYTDHDMFDTDYTDYSGVFGFTSTDNRFVKEACFTTNTRIGGLRLYSNCAPNKSQERIGRYASSTLCSPCAYGNDHGTMVAGVALGRAAQEKPKLKGVAIGSDLIAVNVFSRVQDENFCGYHSGFGYSCVVALDSDVLAGLDYVYSLRNLYNIAAVNLSLGGGAFQKACDSTSVFTSIIKKFHKAKIAVVVAAGNEGSGTSISEPACVSKAIAVGSVSTSNQVSAFTNSNPLIDFWAPGESIKTASDDGISGYITVNGTSFSAPHVSGAIAILKSYNKSLTVDEIKSILKKSGLPIKDPLNGITRPLIQIGASLENTPRSIFVPPVLRLLLLEN